MLADWVIGVVIALVAAVFGNLGTNLQKLAHMQTSQSTYTSHPAWYAGLACMILAALGDFAALGFAPQSIIAPLGSFTLVANLAFASIMLGERLTLRDLASTILIAGGCTLAIGFSNHSEKDYSVAELNQFFAASSFWVYTVVILGLIGALFAEKRYAENLRATNHPKYAAHHRLHRFCVPALSGVVGSQSMLFAKVTAQLIILLFQGDGEVIRSYETYIFIGLLLTTIFFQVKWLNDALSLFNATYVVPVFQTFWIGVSVIAGLVVYQEYLSMNGFQSSMFAFGTCLSLCGVILLSRRKVSDPDGVEEFALLDQEDMTIRVSVEGPSRASAEFVIPRLLDPSPRHSIPMKSPY